MLQESRGAQGRQTSTLRCACAANSEDHTGVNGLLGEGLYVRTTLAKVKQLLLANSLYCTFNFSQNGRLADSKHRGLVLAGGLAVRNTEVGQRHGIPHFA